ncbi:MAG: bifunctional adenosylcobinamide kinase/adenosylcobinamide-phosphate guanylyltransferase [Eubacteriales bacterium]|nr:bifunctional adenosylcobinamide kinase/adenosylcobinamide-phosphate guanylyltransferase [Eubacteriales bacterium]
MILVIGGAYQGKEEYVEKNFAAGYAIVKEYHLKIREQMKAGLEPLEEAKKLLAGADIGNDLVVICDEVGYGLVPVDAFERAWRETVGRVCCYFAKEADQVIRVVCGVGSRIK